MKTLFKTITASQLSPANEQPEKKAFFPEEKKSADFLFIRDLELDMFVGVLPHEKDKKQRVLVNIELAVEPVPGGSKDEIRNVVSYADIVENIENIAAGGHINLLESFAEKIAASCLEDKRAREISVCVEKTDIFKNARGVGCRIIRRQG